MAARKRSASKAAAPSSALTAYDPEWAKEFEDHIGRSSATASGTVGWPFISLKGGQFNYNNEANDGPLDVVILGAIRENAFYTEAYDPNNPQSPVCFALDYDEATMAPPETLETRESETCAGCPLNAFGSDPEGGKGKACKNSVRLALVPADVVSKHGEVDPDVEGARLRVPVMSLKGWSTYASKILKGMHRPLFSVVTALSIEKNERSQFLLNFEPVEGFSIDTTRLLKVRADEAETFLEAVPEAPAAEDKPEKKSRRRPVRGGCAAKAASAKSDKPPRRGAAGGARKF